MPPDPGRAPSEPTPGPQSSNAQLRAWSSHKPARPFRNEELSFVWGLALLLTPGNDGSS